MALLDDLRAFVIEWNNLFPIDKWWRGKYAIPFNSEAHLNASQVDILFEYIEVEIFDNHSNRLVEVSKKQQLMKKGEWLSTNDVQEEGDDAMFDNLEI